MKRTTVRGILVGVAFLAMQTQSFAMFMQYTNAGDFAAAILGLNSTTIDFESEESGVQIVSGNVIGNTTFTYDIYGESMGVIDAYSTTSGTNSLGLLNDDGAFWDGDGFELSFAESVTALGLYFITSDPVIDDEIQIITDAGTAFVDADTYQVLGDGGYAYYLGLTSDTSFSTATISFLDDGETNFVFNIDDITTATVTPVPEPSTIFMVLAGLGGLVPWRKFIGQEQSSSNVL